MTMTPDDLVEIHAIEQLKFRYLRFVDLKMWDEVEPGARDRGDLHGEEVERPAN